jgi:soluble lytic murein transglycosylase-like protein
MRTLRPVWLCVLLLLWGGQAVAGSLYRCKGPNGETAYTSSRAGYSQCRLIKTFEDKPNTAPALQSAGTGKAVGAVKPSVEFRSAPGANAPAAPQSSTPPDRSNRGAVYRYVKDGVTHYTNRRPVGVKSAVLFTYIENCYACTVRSGVDFQSVTLNLDAFSEEIATSAANHGVDPAFVRAVMHAESAFNPNALSRVGAQGLMQLMPATADRFGVENAFEPAQNIEGGTRYLAWLLKRFNGDTRLAAAAYNSGEGSVDRYGGVPPFDETLVFVERVGILHGRYASQLAAAGGGGAGSPASTAAR